MYTFDRLTRVGLCVFFACFVLAAQTLAQNQLPPSSQYTGRLNPEREMFSGKIVKLTNVAWDKCLNLRDIGNHNGGNPDVFGCVQHTDQEWTIEGIPGEAGRFWIRNRSWNKCLNLQSPFAQNGGNPNVWDCVNHLDQSWQLANYAMADVVGVGQRLVAQIYNLNHNMCLNLQNNGNYNGGLPNVWECTTHPDQYWYIETLSDWEAHN